MVKHQIRNILKSVDKNWRSYKKTPIHISTHLNKVKCQFQEKSDKKIYTMTEYNPHTYIKLYKKFLTEIRKKHKSNLQNSSGIVKKYIHRQVEQ